jgi:hypothetical protein
MRHPVWAVDSIRQFASVDWGNVRNVIVGQWVDGGAHIAPLSRTFLDRGKIETKSIDRQSRNVRPFI